MEKEITKEMFANVYGYKEVKMELNRIKEWLSDKSLLENQKIMLPKGVIFHGRPGNGKTLILREFAKSFNAPIYTITGENDNVCAEIIEKFTKARDKEFALILIDEIDLIIGNSARIERTLQQEMDGIETRGSILVLATTNHIRNIDDALLRPGRFDRIIEINYPDKESRKTIVKNFVRDLDVDDTKVDYDHVAKCCSRCSVAELKAVCNDAFLRCKESFSTEEIEKSYERIVHNDYTDQSKEYKDYRVAIHEAGHALVALNFKENWTFYNAKFNATGGVTEIQETDERADTVAKRKQQIMIGMGGYVAEEVMFGSHEVGSWQDFNKIQDGAERLIERVCINGIKSLVTVESYDRQDKHWTEEKVKANQKAMNRLIKKLESKTRKYLKAHKKDLDSFAKTMLENGKCTYKDVSSICA